MPRLVLVTLAASVALAACSSEKTTTSSAGDGGTGDAGTTPTSGGVLACTQAANADDSDSDCVAAGKARKLECATETELEAALAAGCVREDPAEADDFDVCCPKTVEGSKTTSVACQQKAGADTDSECADRPETPRKLDCDAADTNAALAAGCVPVTSGASDVCCPKSVSGTP